MLKSQHADINRYLLNQLEGGKHMYKPLLNQLQGDKHIYKPIHD